jgi:hypothetical protein
VDVSRCIDYATMAKEWGDAAMEVKEIYRFGGELLF